MSTLCKTCGERVWPAAVCGLCGRPCGNVEHAEILRSDGGASVVHRWHCAECNPTRWERLVQWFQRLLGLRACLLVLVLAGVATAAPRSAYKAPPKVVTPVDGSWSVTWGDTVYPATFADGKMNCVWHGQRWTGTYTWDQKAGQLTVIEKPEGGSPYTWRATLGAGLQGHLDTFPQGARVAFAQPTPTD